MCNLQIPREKVVANRVQCFSLYISASIASKYKISKYPTLKMFRYGEAMKKEYRGQRSASAFLKYIDDQLVSPVTKLTTHDQMQAISVSTLYGEIALSCVQVIAERFHVL